MPAPALARAALLLPLLTACTSPGATPSTTSDGSAGGKADGLGDISCPADVAINAADGASRRCFDEATGRFVPTACCADLCEGAGWREQTNGRACAWLDDPGTDGAQVGQFAPSLCCALNDDLACARAELDGDTCRDPQSDAVVDEACCAEEPDVAECHPLVESSVRECVHVRMLETDPSVPPQRPTELLELCTTEGDITGPMRDELCAVFPDESVCALPFEEFHVDVLGACGEALREQYDCAFGTRFRDIAKLPNNAIVREARLTVADVGSLDDIAREQVVIAARQSAFDDVASVEAAFEAFDQGELNVLDTVEISTGRPYRALEYGAGDNSFGAIFELSSTTMVARIQDGDMLHPGEAFALGCDVPFGVPGLVCSNHEACGQGLRCEGAISEHPAGGVVGRCVDHRVSDDAPANEARCTAPADCPIDDGLVCSGLSIFDEGFCRPAWVLGQFHDDNTIALPAQGTLQRDLAVWGLATVPEDAFISLRLLHPDPTTVTITLVPALRDEGTPFVVFDGATDPAAVGTTTVVIDKAIAHPGDESLNGLWSIVVEDTAAGGAGQIDTWSLRFSSRMD